MSYDPTNPDESLPRGLEPPTVAEPAAAAPPPPPPPADPLFDEPGVAAAAPAARSSRGEGVDKKTLIGAGVGAAVIALGAVFGINLASSSADDATNTAATGPMGMNGQSGQFPGGQSGADGQSGQQGQMGQLPGEPPGSTGTVEDVGDGTLTISTDDGQSVEVTTTDDTEVSISQSQSADDIDEGDTVLVIGQSSDGSSVTAERVVERSGDDGADQGGPGGRGPTVGEVSSVDGDSFTLTTDSGDITVTLTDDTTVVVERQASVSDLSEGDEVFVHTETADDGSTWAERIITGDELPDLSAGPGGMSGGMQGGPQGSAGGQSGTLAPPSQGSTGSTDSNLAPASPSGSGSTGGAPGANAGPSGVTTT